tara:strand:+ start:248 stop:514 length:267 start_codon:yes stop_codon:yes gene_type:complete
LQKGAESILLIVQGEQRQDGARSAQLFGRPVRNWRNTTKIILGKTGSIMEAKDNALIKEPERMFRTLFLLMPFLLGARIMVCIMPFSI